MTRRRGHKDPSWSVAMREGGHLSRHPGEVPPPPPDTRISSLSAGPSWIWHSRCHGYHHAWSTPAGRPLGSSCSQRHCPPRILPPLLPSSPPPLLPSSLLPLLPVLSGSSLPSSPPSLLTSSPPRLHLSSPPSQLTSSPLHLLPSSSPPSLPPLLLPLFCMHREGSR